MRIQIKHKKRQNDGHKRYRTQHIISFINMNYKYCLVMFNGITFNFLILSYITAVLDRVNPSVQ